jgi:hypothetical protein
MRWGELGEDSLVFFFAKLSKFDGNPLFSSLFCFQSLAVLFQFSFPFVPEDAVDGLEIFLIEAETVSSIGQFIDLSQEGHGIFGFDYCQSELANRSGVLQEKPVFFGQIVVT